MTNHTTDVPVDEPTEADATDATAAVTGDIVGSEDSATTAEALGLTLPAEPDEAIELLLRELKEARTEADDLLDNVQRIAAEFDNFRKRVERDRVENVQRAGQRVIELLLPALDSFDAALAIEANSATEHQMSEGMRGTHALLLEALAREGCEPIPSVGEPFNPAVHEAVSVLPGEGEQVVDQELRKGYTMSGRVIRPALVIVGHA